MTNSAELLPCPMAVFSWLPEHRLRLADGLQDRWGQATEFAAGCEGCDIYTPQCKTREEAIAAWNTRASSRLQGDDLERLTRPIIGLENRTALEVFDMMCDRIRHARAALEAMSGWSLIDSAPKDGTRILIAGGKLEVAARICVSKRCLQSNASS